ncbi:MAG: L,D-transpeptidase family protein [Flavobacteriia bacterium]|nr:L,D-transpeptidase family protein [Flavobacteriia bacterium]
MTKKTIFFLSVTLFIFISCKQKKEIDSILNKEISNNEKLKHLLTEETDELNFLTKELKKKLEDFYRKRNFQPLWIKNDSLNSKSLLLIEELKKPLAFGLPENRHLKFNKDLHPLISELKITFTLKCFQNDLQNGFMNDSLKEVKPIDFSDDFSKIEQLLIAKDACLSEEIIKWGLNDTLYRALSNHLYQFYTFCPHKEDKVELPTQKEDSIKSVNIMRTLLKNKNYIGNENVDTSILFASLKRFQLENGLKQDGKIGKLTAKSLMESQIDKCKRLALNLEKLRHKKIKKGYYLEINLPEFVLRFYHDDTLKSFHRVIIGTEENQSPELSSNVFRIITYPLWSVPFSITSKEFLPILKRNPNYLSQNNMILLKNNEEINPIDVNWKKISKNTFPYKVIQNSGKSNSLGIIKLDFQNKYGVYVHDTPNKGLFNNVFRSYSHGCIRCEHPVDLAKQLLLSHEKNMISDSLDSLLNRKVHQYIPLKSKIPIEIYYLTISLSNNGEVILLADLYNRDETLIQKIFD